MSLTNKIQDKPRLKLVVRGLPSQLNEEQFKNLLESSTWNQIDFWYYRPGRITDKKVIYSKAFLNFIDELSLSKFWYQFNGHIFVNTKGKENRATVEYAPFQKIPKSKRKLDSRENTIGEGKFFFFCLFGFDVMR